MQSRRPGRLQSTLTSLAATYSPFLVTRFMRRKVSARCTSAREHCWKQCCTAGAMSGRGGGGVEKAPGIFGLGKTPQKRSPGFEAGGGRKRAPRAARGGRG